MKPGTVYLLHLCAIFAAVLVVVLCATDPVTHLFLQKSATRWIALAAVAFYVPVLLTPGKQINRLWDVPIFASLAILVAVATPILDGYWTRQVVAAHERQPGSSVALDRPEDFFSAKYGPLLIGSEKAMQRSYYKRVEQAQPVEDIVTDRGMYAFAWLAFRRQGRSEEEIFAARNPDGRRLFLGTMLAQISPTTETPKWILDPKHPEIVSPAFARKCFGSLVERLADDPKHWTVPLLIIALEHPEMASPATFDLLLGTWEQMRVQDLKEPSIVAAVGARQALLGALNGRTRVNVDYPENWGKAARENCWRELGRFLSTAGVKLEQDPAGAPLSIRWEKRLYKNVLAQEIQRTTRREKYKETYTREVAGPSFTQSLQREQYPGQHYSHTETRQVEKVRESYEDELISKYGDLQVPTLLLNVAGAEEVSIPPVTTIALTAMRRYQSEDPAQMTAERRAYFEEAFTSFLSEGLHFGLHYYSQTRVE
jgi:hypothetical protein